jgi:hypothetical protein
MYSVSIHKLESRRSGKDRRDSTDSKPNDSEMRTGKDRRSYDDRRNEIGRRLGIYCILSDQQKERLDKIIRLRDIEASDLVIG